MQVTSEGPIKITKATIDAAWRRRQKDQRLIIRDKDCRGLSLIVNQTTMTWSYVYRPPGKDLATGKRWGNRTLTLGNPASLSIDEARGAANRAKGQVKSGADPVEARKAKLAEDQRKRTETLSRLVELYAKALPKRQKKRGDGLPSPRYVAEELANLNMALAEMKAEALPAADLTEAHVRGLLNSVEGKTTARHRFGPLSRFMGWCREAGYIAENPCAKIDRPKAPKPRNVAPKLQDLARLWKAAERLDKPVWCDLARFLIAIPCRRGEAAGLEWSHLDLNALEWGQPGQITKNGDAHRLHLHPLAMGVLISRRRAWAEAQGDGDPQKVARILASGWPRAGLVFPAPRSGDVVDTFTNLKAALIEATKPIDGEEGALLTGWTFHDFRRSFVTVLAESRRVPEVICDAMLNHRQSATRGGVLGIYQVSERWEEQVEAMQLWGRLLAAAIEGREAGAEVVQLHSASG
jgi:integrase